MPSSGPQLQEILAKAAELVSDEERAAYLSSVCAETGHRFDDLAAMLATQAKARGHQSTIDGTATRFDDSPPPIATSGSRVGEYILREKIGEGGMGVVYVAEREDGAGPKVAIKLIKPGMDSKEVISRFESERETLRLMQHPYIAKVLDGGTTSAGHPFFVMELVRGVPINTYCARHNLGLRQRLQLFGMVCDALQHAHIKGVIHRDLKAENVLVENRGSITVPKVIDFGVAKALDRRLTNPNVYTRFAALVGTPQFMSPEQTNLPGQDVDTRSDVYALGILLYELVTGALPFDDELLHRVGLDEFLRIIRSTPPVRPSARVAASLKQPVEATAAGQISPTGRVPREIDWIVMKALEKEPDRRYQSARRLAEDVESYLAGRPVSAGPPSGMYRLQKYVHRHWRLLAMSGLVMMTAAVGAAVSFWYAQDARTQADMADSARRTAEDSNLRMRKLVYAGDMAAASRFFQEGDLRSFSEVLTRYEQPEPAQPDLRGFEWWYLHHLIEIDSHSVAHRPEQACLIRFSPDRRRLAIGWSDGVTEIRDANTSQVQLTLEGHGDFVYGCDFHPTEEILATIADTGTVRLWDLTDGRMLREFRVCSGHAHRVCFVTDGKTLATAGEEGRVRFWNTATGESTGEIGGFSDRLHGGVERALACSPDRKVIAIGHGESSAFLFDAATRKTICSLQGLDGDNVRTFRFSNSRPIVAGAMNSNRICLWNTTTGEQLAVFEGHLEQVQDLAFHPTDRLLVSSDRGGIVRTWPIDAALAGARPIDPPPDSAVIQTPPFSRPARRFEWPDAFRAHADRALSLDFSPDGQRLLTGSRDQTVFAWREAFAESNSTIVDETLLAAEFLAEKSQLLVASETQLELWNLTSGERRVVAAFEHPCVKMHADPGRELVATVHADGRLRIWNSNTWKVVSELPLPEPDLQSVSLAPDFSIVATKDPAGESLSFWSFAASVSDKPEFQRDEFDNAWIAPSGEFALLHHLNDLCVVALPSGEISRRLIGHADTVRSVTFTADPRRIVSTSADRTVRVWDLDSGICEHVIFAHDNPVDVAVLSPDGKTLASGDAGGVLVLTHFETGRAMLETAVGQGAVADLDFSPDGSSLIVVQENRLTVLHGDRGDLRNQESGDGTE